jgi:TolB protein
MIRTLALIAATALGLVAASAQQPQQPPPAPPAAPQQPAEISTTISSDAAGAPPRMAVPNFIALAAASGRDRTPDRETADAASRIAQVLWDDINFEHEFALIPRDVYKTVPAATSMFDVPFDRWRELNADGLVIGSVQKTDAGVRVEVRLFNVRTGQAAFSREYTGSIANPRLYAHTIADEIHKEQRGLRGVARTRLTFNSDRDGERVVGTVEKREAKEIYIADYDGFNQRRITLGRELNVTSVWSPDTRSLAYVSWRRGPPNVFVSNIYSGLPAVDVTKSAGNNFTPVWSPDGTRIAFSSTRDGNPEIYVMNADGSNIRRLTNHPANDITPTWSPTGTQIAFTSNRAGDPSIYIMGADGVGVQRLTSGYSDRPTWSPAPYNEVAYAARTGPGNDIRIIDLSTREIRQLTFSEGTNESPAFAPNGRHLAFSSTRSGRTQIFTISRTGKDLRQITRDGNNYQPHWSN